MASVSISDALFTKTQQRVLGLIYGNPQRRFYANEVVRLAGMGRGTVSRELERLVDAGLLMVKPEGNKLLYQANPQCLIYDELVGIARKTLGAVNQDKKGISVEAGKFRIGRDIVVSRAALKRLAKKFHIQRLSLFGSAARGELSPQSDIDVLVEFEKDLVPSLGGMVEIQDALSRLFADRKVDIATPVIFNNPYRRRSIKQDMEELYVAEGS